MMPDTSYLYGFPDSLIESLEGILGALIPFFITAALVVFLWGLLKFMSSVDSETAKESGRRLMVWGIVTLFVMVTVWGLVALLNRLTGVWQGEDVHAPNYPISR
jgi:hypothetical protein